MDREDTLARSLGVLSLALGLSEIAAPSHVARLVGVPDDPTNRLVLRVLGAREVITGLALLGGRRSAGWLWGRVGGDVLDVTLLGLGLRSEGADLARGAVATGVLLGVGALDLGASLTVSRERRISSGMARGSGIRVT
jgi:hypothetical protein